MNRIAMLVVALAMGAATTLLACAASRDARGEGMDTASMPDDVKDDYEVFARRCSKCHSLARPLNSGIDDDEFWINYVARMRRQPGSGINQADSVVILRFLRYFSREQRKLKANGGSTSSASKAHGESIDSGVTQYASPASLASPASPDASRLPELPTASPAVIDGGL